MNAATPGKSNRPNDNSDLAALFSGSDMEVKVKPRQSAGGSKIRAKNDQTRMQDNDTQFKHDSQAGTLPTEYQGSPEQHLE